MSLEEETKWYDYLVASIKSLANPSLYGSELVIRASKRKSDALKELQNQLNLTNAEMKAFLQANPNIIKTLNRLSEIIKEEDEYVQSETEKIFKEIL